ncbi:MAG: DNA methyltransferase [Bacteroidetes bacterium]|nr:MAG: DNA methyltransferase [Bacteroidota bacterium]TAG87436.1 MAG: DNA methyltransferase [Bacteroidota bacterium]
MTLQQYITNLNQEYISGIATEHTYRSDLKQLIESLVVGNNIVVTNEPKRIACGAPDYVLTKNDIPFGFIEAKDIGDKDLWGAKKTGNKEQFDRYKASLDNLIFTDYLDFHFYIEGNFIIKIAIGEVKNGKIFPLPDNFLTFSNLIKNFCLYIGQTIKNPKKLAEMMAGKARLLADTIELSLISDEKNKEESTLKDQINAFKQILIHDITAKSFADVYAQTIAYGMFAARLHDPTLPTFSRQKAAELIPKSNPFLRKLFGYIAGPEIDDRIKWVVDSLVEIFLACNVNEILKNYGQSTKMENPIIHFYETFLSEYDANLRKTRGVWYTPKPVVSFIVRAVDEILKTEFNLSDGLADRTTSKIKINQQGKMIEKEVQKVQILDPATGTGTFLAEIIEQIYQKFEGQKGIWSDYVENYLLPRLNGFELLMASYAMAHLQIDLLLSETEFAPKKEQRLRIFLTNSLEESHPDTHTLFANWLSTEANEANFIKRDAPVMCVLGNPPYSGESANKGSWIMKLMEDYKKEPNSKQKLQEQNPKWLNDDYVKFIRYGQYFIEKNGSGVLAFINPHGFLDNPTFRGMRWHLLKTFDKIYTIDLHGNAKKKEISPDGSIDMNVFDIMQGVSINIFIKNGSKKNNELGKVFHFDLFGKREFKYEFLNQNSLKSVPYKELSNIAPNYFFVNKDFEEQKNYDKGFSITELFEVNSVGIVTARDEFTIHFSEKKLKENIDKFISLDDETARYEFNLGKDARDWKVNLAKKDLQNHYPKKGYFVKISYRPFDERYTFYTGNSKGFHCMPRHEVMQHFLENENLGLISIRRSRSNTNWQEIFITKNIISGSTAISSLDINYLFPLYLYPKKKKISQLFLSKIQRDKYDLMIRLKQAKEHLKQIKDFFNKTVLPFYEAIEKPDTEKNTLFEENKSTYEEAKTSVEKIENQIKDLENQQNNPAQNEQDVERVPNLSSKIIKNIAQNLDLIFVNEKQKNEETFSPIDILDYIYAVLHSNIYREKYSEFLKTDFPKIPFPNDKNKFWKLIHIGKKIREIHLLEDEMVDNYQTKFDINGKNNIEKIKFEDEKVFINEKQYFSNVPKNVWEFYIGGYQPAQKWLKDRKDTILSLDDIVHYQKIITALTHTHIYMKQIDEIGIE